MFLARAGSTAVPLLLPAVSFADAQSISAVIPRGLELGAWNLIVVNPDRTVGTRACGV